MRGRDPLRMDMDGPRDRHVSGFDPLAALGSALSAVLPGSSRHGLIRFDASELRERVLATVVENDVVVAACLEAARGGNVDVMGGAALAGIEQRAEDSFATVTLQHQAGAAGTGPTQRSSSTPPIADGTTATTATATTTTTTTTTVGARLVIGAEGAASPTRAHAGISFSEAPYNQRAVVCAVSLESATRTAWQAFLGANGPLAVLPMFPRHLEDRPDGGARVVPRATIVWSCEPAVAKSLAARDEADFVEAANEALRTLNADSAEGGAGGRSGAALDPPRITGVDGARFHFPLRSGLAASLSRGRVALAGDAAHCIHPLAGQGLNLGLGDVAALMSAVSGSVRAGVDPGTRGCLAHYERVRAPVNVAMTAGNHTIQRLFSTNLGPLSWARGAGLAFTDTALPIKDTFARIAMGAHVDLRDVGSLQRQ
jgi:ubiquinone biosynthesis monooxygenase Coq6